MVSPGAKPREYNKVNSSPRGRTAGERILGFVCDAAGELAAVLKGFIGVGMGGNGSLGYVNAKADWNIDDMSSAHTPPSTKCGFSMLEASAGCRMRTNEGYRPPPKPLLHSILVAAAPRT